MDASQANFADIPEALQKKCIYCVKNGVLREDQILLRSKHLFICAPRGQIVEGYLVIAPLSCTGSLSALPAACFPEINLIVRLVAAFYLETYGVAGGILYEQGRGGGGARMDAIGGFPHHAHLCCLPLAVNLHALLSQRYVRKSLSGPEELPAIVPNSPYIYVEGPDIERRYKRCVYLPGSEKGRLELERMRLKRVIAELLGLPDRWDWRSYPGDRELDTLIERFHLFRRKVTIDGVRL